MIRYSSGEWYALVTEGRLALLDPSTDPAVVTAVWESLRAGDDVAAQLQPMLRPGLAAMPPFALVVLDDGAVPVVHAVVRGDVTVADQLDAALGEQAFLVHHDVDVVLARPRRLEGHLQRPPALLLEPIDRFVGNLFVRLRPAPFCKLAALRLRRAGGIENSGNAKE